jgi:hypothetical protein
MKFSVCCLFLLANVGQRAASAPSQMALLIEDALNSTGVFHSLGLDGLGEVLGVSDTGVDEKSCFFANTPNELPISRINCSDEETCRAVTFSRPERRKVVQYVFIPGRSDETDGPSGLGTGAAGAAVGACLDSSMSAADGSAPRAQLAVFDLSVSDSVAEDGAYTILSDPLAAWLPQNASGARIHLNGWTLGPTSTSAAAAYTYTAEEAAADAFSFDNPENLLIFPSGDQGAKGGLSSLAWSAGCKNGISVGASSMRLGLEDSLDGGRTRVAPFSALGPLPDGRFGVDLVAPGDGVLAALVTAANTTATTYSTTDWSAVGEQRSTGAAAGVIAGGALLVRQYLRNTSFWASACVGPVGPARCPVQDGVAALQGMFAQPCAALVKVSLIFLSFSPSLLLSLSPSLFHSIFFHPFILSFFRPFFHSFIHPFLPCFFRHCSFTVHSQPVHTPP